MNNTTSHRFPSVDSVLSAVLIVGLAVVGGLTLVVAALPTLA